MFYLPVMTSITGLDSRRITVMQLDPTAIRLTRLQLVSTPGPCCCYKSTKAESEMDWQSLTTLRVVVCNNKGLFLLMNYSLKVTSLCLTSATSKKFKIPKIQQIHTIQVWIKGTDWNCLVGDFYSLQYAKLLFWLVVGTLMSKQHFNVLQLLEVKPFELLIILLLSLIQCNGSCIQVWNVTSD